MQLADVFMLGALLCSGLSGGIGFLNVLGFVPGMRDTPKEHFLYFWQAIDKYMRKRMPVFMMALLICVTGSIVITLQQSYHVPCWWLSGCLFFMVVDFIIAYSSNLPANQFIQSPDTSKAPDSPEYAFFFAKRQTHLLCVAIAPWPLLHVPLQLVTRSSNICIRYRTGTD